MQITDRFWVDKNLFLKVCNHLMACTLAAYCLNNDVLSVYLDLRADHERHQYTHLWNINRSC